MKKMISFLLSLTLVLCSLTALADTPFLTLAQGLIREIETAPDGFEINVFNEDQNVFALTVLNDNGSFKELRACFGGNTLYAGDTGITVSVEGTNITLPYELFESAASSGLGFDPAALGELLGTLIPELVQKMTELGAVKIAMDASGLTFSVSGQQFLTCLDTVVDSLITDHSAEIDSILTGNTLGFLPADSAELMQRWRDLKIHTIDPGFETAEIALLMTGENGNTIEIRATVDGKQVFDAVMTQRDGFDLVAHVAGHELKANVSVTSDGSLWYAGMILDGKDILNISGAEGSIRMSMMDNQYSAEASYASDPLTLSFCDNTDNITVDLSIRPDPFDMSECIGYADGDSMQTVIRQIDADGSCECMLELLNIWKHGDGTEETISSGLFLIDRNGNGYTVRGKSNEEDQEITLLTISLAPEKITPPDPGTVLTNEMIMQLLQTIQ